MSYPGGAVALEAGRTLDGEPQVQQDALELAKHVNKGTPVNIGERAPARQAKR